MPGTATGLNMGWSPVTITPGTGTAITLKNVTSLTPSRLGEIKKFYGDVNAFPQLAVNRNKGRTVSITSGSIGQLMSLPEDTVCTIAATLNDPLNGAAVGGGGYVITLTNAILKSNNMKGDTNEYALGSVEFECFSPTGTDPMTVVAL
jgi:hypothetical protein